MKRRDFLALSSLAAADLALGLPPLSRAAAAARDKSDFSIRIAPVKLEIAPGNVIKTVGYNGKVPGPILRMREGKRVTVDVHNDTDMPELVHWHGQFVSFRRGRLRGRRNAARPRARQPPVHVCAGAGRVALVSHAHAAKGTSRSRHVHGPIRIFLRGAEERAGKLRSGNFSGRAPLGAFARAPGPAEQRLGNRLQAAARSTTKRSGTAIPSA